MIDSLEFFVLPGSNPVNRCDLLASVLVFSILPDQKFIAIARTTDNLAIVQLGTMIASKTNATWDGKALLGYQYNVDLELNARKKEDSNENLVLFRANPSFEIDRQLDACKVLYFASYVEEFVIVTDNIDDNRTHHLAGMIETLTGFMWDCDAITVEEHNENIERCLEKNSELEIEYLQFWN
jgi:hypothetical protein